MNRREFAWTTISSLAAAFASSTPLIMAVGACTFCARSYPEAGWIVESVDAEKRICDRCAGTLEQALDHLAKRDYDTAVAILEERFPSHVRALQFQQDAESAPFLMM